MLIQQFLKTPRWIKRAISVSYDAFVIYLSFLAAWAVRVGSIDFQYTYLDQISVSIAACASIFIFVRLGLYRAILRYVTHDAFITIALGVTLSALLMAASSFMIGGTMPRSVPIIYGCVAFIVIGAPRILFRSIVHWLNPSKNNPVIIYGAGETGNHLAGALQTGSEFHPVAFIDDNKLLQNTSIRGIPVFAPSALNSLIQKHRPSTLLLALGNYDKSNLAKILKSIGPLGIKIATIPKIADLVYGKSAITDIQEVKIADVLGRDPVAPIPQLLHSSVTEKIVLVTGAGGSIGSEICRQVLTLKPKVLILFDNSEYNLFKLNEELNTQQIKGNLTVHCVLGDIRNEKSIGDAITKFKPNTIYHAAAYKHVPIVEDNPWEGIRNNSYGTLLVGRAAMRNNVANMVLISTDKAVRPTNVMGATKRMAELIIQALQQSPENICTCFSAVRFGNVLDSSGSVLPKFRKQIAEGGPVTVTHPKVTRYFMTLQEAAQLVIQAGAMSSGGNVFVLDMGEPVKILDIAKEMIALSFTLDHQNKKVPEIEFIGLRPGEKLYEELLLTDQCFGTAHPRIWLDGSVDITPELLIELPDQLETAIANRDIPALESLVMSKLTNYQKANVTAENFKLEKSNVVHFKDTADKK